MFSYAFITIPPDSPYENARLDEIFSLVNERVDKPQHGIINISFVDDVEMQKYNKYYRGKDATTDVLSFHYFDDFSICDDDEVVGECIFSHARIRDQALEYNHSIVAEFEILLIHSLLHILGYDHENDADFQEMFRIECAIRGHMGLNIER